MVCIRKHNYTVSYMANPNEPPTPLLIVKLDEMAGDNNTAHLRSEARRLAHELSRLKYRAHEERAIDKYKGALYAINKDIVLYIVKQLTV